MIFDCMCARFQSDPKEYHLTTVKIILRYLVHTPHFDLVGYFNIDYARCKVDRMSTSGN
jgi:hypothetical protein